MTRPTAVPPHETADRNRTAESALSVMKDVILNQEKWSRGAQVTGIILGDRFCLSREEGVRGLELLEQENVLEKVGNCYFVR
ncbi:MAG: hypothetical protein J5J00_11640 [Deltaproteobacteria bacterium]|nr:hypothetical protein [Deltaproteobacteria bacterium]